MVCLKHALAKVLMPDRKKQASKRTRKPARKKKAKAPSRAAASAKFPLGVLIAYHPASDEAEEVASHLYCLLNDGPLDSGLRIPTYFSPEDGSGEPPELGLPHEVDKVAVVLLSDDHLAANASSPTKNGKTWGEYAVGLHSLCDKAKKGARFIPVQLSQHAYPIRAELSELNFLRAWAEPTIERKKALIARRLVHSPIRILNPNAAEGGTHPLTVFISHTKLDLDLEPRPVRVLLSHLTAQQPEKTWFDSGDIESGSRFAAEIERGVKDTALLAVVTDSYSSRAWCRREVLFAKKHQRPVVVVNAIQNREVRSFPYSGNVPVVRWKGDANEVLDLLLRESLKLRYAELYLEKLKRPGDLALPAGPELLTLVLQKPTGSILYPDPPFGVEEVDILQASGLSVETPLERHARENTLPKGVAIALSVSESEDLPRFGLRKQHLDALQMELSRYLLLSGASLAYGGDLRDDGYTLQLVNLLRDPLLERLRDDKRKRGADDPQLISYLAWPIATSANDLARLGYLVDVRRMDRPHDIDETLDPAFTKRPTEFIPITSVERRYGWSRGLTDMRGKQIEQTSAKVIVGGRFGSEEHPYMGRMPGVLEEVLLALRESQPVYLIGALGGCARVLLDALDGRPSPVLTAKYHQGIPHSADLPNMYSRRGIPWDTFEDVAAYLSKTGLDGLNNGLTKTENLELRDTRSAERIVSLVLTGIRSVV